VGVLHKFKSTLQFLGLEAELDNRIFVERAHRIRLLRPADLVCQLEVNGQTYNAQVRDVSESGIGFSVKSLPDLGFGTQFDVFFASGKESFPATIEIVRKTEAVIGARLLGEGEPWRLFLRRHFNMELNAGNLALVDSSLLKKEEHGTSWWFFSPEGRELFVVAEDDHIRKYHLVFDGHYFDGDARSFRYGRIRDDRKEGGIKEAHQIIPMAEGAPVQDAIRFVSNIERLPENFLNEILSSLKNPASSS
jgi:hypothetical protein